VRLFFVMNGAHIPDAVAPFQAGGIDLRGVYQPNTLFAVYGGRG